MKVAVLASSNMMPGAADQREDAFERDEQMGKLVPALAAHGVGCELVEWRGADRRADEFAAVMPLLCWDYWDHREEFLRTMERAAERTKVFNAPDTLRWNTDKSYLDELGSKGARLIPTEVVERFSDEAAMNAYAAFGTNTLVVKPLVGGGAWRQALLKQGEPLPPESELPPAETMIQPFLPSVVEEGETSMLFFGGKFSHALQKTARSGDYRIQSQYGGREVPIVPEPEVAEFARSQLALLDETPLYARVDLLRGLDGEMCLIEMEMVEPYLYLGLSEGEGGENRGAKAFAEALVGLL